MRGLDSGLVATLHHYRVIPCQWWKKAFFKAYTKKAQPVTADLHPSRLSRTLQKLLVRPCISPSLHLNRHLDFTFHPAFVAIALFKVLALMQLPAAYVVDAADLKPIQ